MNISDQELLHPPPSGKRTLPSFAGYRSNFGLRNPSSHIHTGSHQFHSHSMTNLDITNNSVNQTASNREFPPINAHRSNMARRNLPLTQLKRLKEKAIKIQLEKSDERSSNILDPPFSSGRQSKDDSIEKGNVFESIGNEEDEE